MGIQANIVYVMVASPSDVPDERAIITEELQRWNDINGFSRKIYLSPLKWETHSTPQLGAPPQQIINGQLLDAADILIGVFGTRIGTPTENFISGTVEEIKKHVAAGRTAKIYFSDAPVSPSTIDQSQYAAVQQFRAECQTLGLYATYLSLEGFRDDFQRHLGIELNLPRYAWLKPSIFPVSVDDVPSITSEAKELLLGAAQTPSGLIIHRRSLSSEILQVGNKAFMDGTARSAALWRSAMDELLGEGYVEETTGGSGTFRITKLGYEVADSMGDGFNSPKPLVLKLSVSGPAHAQTLDVRASKSIHAKSIDYLTSTDACIATQELDVEGFELTLPVKHSEAVKLFNSPRPDRNNYDFSGPAKLRLVFDSDGRHLDFLLPVVIQPQIVNSTQWTTFIGSAQKEY